MYEIKENSRILKDGTELTTYSRDVVSANILRRDQIWVAGTDYGSVVVVEVPPAERDQLPVYLGGDPFTGSYRRAWDGDYHCTRAEVVAMLGAKEH